MVTREVKWDKRRNKLLLQIWLLCLSSVFGGNILDTQPLAFSGICTQLPYGHELRIILNLNRNIKTRQGFWSEASFPEEKYYRYPYVHVLRGAKKENAHFSDTALEQNCSCLYKAGAHAGQAQPRHHSTLQHSTAQPLPGPIPETRSAIQKKHFVAVPVPSKSRSRPFSLHRRHFFRSALTL